MLRVRKVQKVLTILLYFDVQGVHSLSGYLWFLPRRPQSVMLRFFWKTWLKELLFSRSHQIIHCLERKFQYCWFISSNLVILRNYNLDSFDGTRNRNFHVSWGKCEQNVNHLDVCVKNVLVHSLTKKLPNSNSLVILNFIFSFFKVWFLPEMMQQKLFTSDLVFDWKNLSFWFLREIFDGPRSSNSANG